MDIKKIRSQFHGKVTNPSDPDYDKERTVLPGDIDHKPQVLIRVKDPADIIKALEIAKAEKLPVSVRSGGHSAAGYGVVDGGLVIDLRDMKAMSIDVSNKTMWAQTGLTAKEVTVALDVHNLVLGFGDTGSVGIGGITLGGGVGYLVRKFGLTIDNVLAAEIITADCQMQMVDAKNHPDLFWGIRGGGGNFGVVTRFRYALQPLTNCIGGMMLLPATPSVITGFIKLAADAPEELSTIANIMPTPPMPMVPAETHGKLSLMALMMYAGDPKKGEKILAPFKKLAPPLTDMIRPMRYKDIFFPDDESYHPTAVAKNIFIREITDDMAKRIIERLNASDATMRVVQLRVLGGESGRIPNDATAYFHRGQQIMANVAAFYNGPKDKIIRQTWIEKLANELKGDVTGAYVGFITPGEEGRIREFYPESTYQRLLKIKQQYDPTNVFHSNLNIEPYAKEKILLNS